MAARRDFERVPPHFLRVPQGARSDLACVLMRQIRSCVLAILWRRQWATDLAQGGGVWAGYWEDEWSTDLLSDLGPSCPFLSFGGSGYKNEMKRRMQRAL